MARNAHEPTHFVHLWKCVERQKNARVHTNVSAWWWISVKAWCASCEPHSGSKTSWTPITFTVKVKTFLAVGKRFSHHSIRLIPCEVRRNIFVFFFWFFLALALCLVNLSQLSQHWAVLTNEYGPCRTMENSSKQASHGWCTRFIHRFRSEIVTSQILRGRTILLVDTMRR